MGCPLEREFTVSKQGFPTKMGKLVSVYLPVVLIKLKTGLWFIMTNLKIYLEFLSKAPHFSLRNMHQVLNDLNL